MDLEKLTMEDSGNGNGEDTLTGRYGDTFDDNNFSQNCTPSGYCERDISYIVLKREVSLRNLNEVQMNEMPGFKISWLYTGTFKTDAVPMYANEKRTKNLVRNIQL